MASRPTVTIPPNSGRMRFAARESTKREFGATSVSLGGPGEVRVTLDFTSGGLAQGAYATLFDQDFVKIDGITMILNRGDSERKVVHIQLSGKQMVIVELDLEGNEISSAGSFLLRVEGAVQFQ